jgi:hypothetical protein
MAGTHAALPQHTARAQHVGAAGGECDCATQVCVRAAVQRTCAVRPQVGGCSGRHPRQRGLVQPHHHPALSAACSEHNSLARGAAVHARVTVVGLYTRWRLKVLCVVGGVGAHTYVC